MKALKSKPTIWRLFKHTFKHILTCQIYANSSTNSPTRDQAVRSGCSISVSGSSTRSMPPCTVGGGRQRHWAVGFHPTTVELCELFAEVDILRRCSAENVAICLQALPQLAFNSCLRGWMLDIVQFRY